MITELRHFLYANSNVIQLNCETNRGKPIRPPIKLLNLFVVRLKMKPVKHLPSPPSQHISIIKLETIVVRNNKSNQNHFIL